VTYFAVVTLGIGLIYGLYSEGFDRLWVKHIIDTFKYLQVLQSRSSVR